jgi:Tol biopolymer transport system component
MLYSDGSTTRRLQEGPAAPSVSVVGIERTKIIIERSGARVVFDPFGDGSYIWPAISPDKNYLSAYEMSRGTIVFTIDGSVVSRLGKRNAAVWERSGKWLIYMDDRDDGHRIISSDIFAVSPDGKTTVQLTTTDDSIEMYPQASSVEDKIVYSTLAGEIFVLTYREVKP